MAKNMTEEQIYAAARKRVKTKKDFLNHLYTYIVVNIIIIGVWMFSGGGSPWFIWTLGPWGIGVLIHFLFVYVFPDKPEENALEQEVKRIREDLE